MSERTALYRLFDAADNLLYVGITKSTAQRWSAHAAKKPWWGEVDRFELRYYPTRAEALDAEERAIRSERPVWNIQMAATSSPQVTSPEPPPRRSSPPGPQKRKRVPYIPSPRLVAASEQYIQARDRWEAQKPVVKALSVQMMATGVPAACLAKRGPYTYETLRQLARAAGIPQRRRVKYQTGHGPQCICSMFSDPDA